MVYNFPQTNIRLCLKEKNIPEYLIESVNELLESPLTLD